MEEIDYTKGIPTALPDEAFDYLLAKEGAIDGECLVYRVAWVKNPLTNKKEKCVEIKCTGCGETFYEKHIAGANSGCHMASYTPFGFFNSRTKESITSYEKTLCPECGSPVTAYHIGAFRNPTKEIDNIFPLTVQEINGRLTLLYWKFTKEVNKYGETSITAWPHEGYILDGKKMIKLCGYLKSINTITYLGYWQQKKKCNVTMDNSTFVCPWDASLLNTTDAENCKLDVYLQSSDETYPITYLRIWQKHKNVENLIMQGASKIVSEKIYATRTYCYLYKSNIEGIDWKEKRPSKMLGLSKSEFKAAALNKWDNADLKFFKAARVAGKEVRTDELEIYKNAGYGNCRLLLEKDVLPIKALRYIEKQKAKYPAAEKIVDVRYLCDYWNMLPKIGENPTDPETAFPQNLIAAHDNAVKRIKYEESQELKKLFKDRYEALSKYSYSNGGFEIRPAKSEREMIIEGKLLHHCIASYAGSHANGGTAIFFIRKSDEPETPFYTLELDEKNIKVRQNRGVRNCSRTKEVKTFEEAWIKYVKKILATGKKQKGKQENAA